MLLYFKYPNLVRLMKFANAHILFSKLSGMVGINNYISIEPTNLFVMVLETTWVWGLAPSDARSMDLT